MTHYNNAYTASNRPAQFTAAAHKFSLGRQCSKSQWCWHRGYFADQKTTRQAARFHLIIPSSLILMNHHYYDPHCVIPCALTGSDSLRGCFFFPGGSRHSFLKIVEDKIFSKALPLSAVQKLFNWKSPKFLPTWKKSKTKLGHKLFLTCRISDHIWHVII